MAHRDYRMLIGGEFVEAAGGQRREAVNPFTRQAFATIPEAGKADAGAAVRAAREAFGRTWSRAPGVERAEFLHRLADLIDARAHDLGALESTDNGKLLRETERQARFAARNYRFFAGYADKLFGQTIPLDSPDSFDYTIREPVGVAALITAWNSPLQLLSNKLAPALAAGNTAVIKPSEHASVTTLELAAMAHEAGFPAGVINVVTGGAEAGNALCSSRPSAASASRAERRPDGVSRRQPPRHWCPSPLNWEESPPTSCSPTPASTAPSREGLLAKGGTDERAAASGCRPVRPGKHGFGHRQPPGVRRTRDRIRHRRGTDGCGSRSIRAHPRSHPR
ncbi:MAG TPA: aldehyde dehydrogenase family protein [Streptosporangiaceae bacterium]|nr:aldehyde dehydrogenase family protein [Streptosporangiaceae bacterium]